MVPVSRTRLSQIVVPMLSMAAGVAVLSRETFLFALLLVTAYFSNTRVGIADDSVIAVMLTLAGVCAIVGILMSGFDMVRTP